MIGWNIMNTPAVTVQVKCACPDPTGPQKVWFEKLQKDHPDAWFKNSLLQYLEIDDIVCLPAPRKGKKSFYDVGDNWMIIIMRTGKHVSTWVNAKAA